MAGMPSAKWSLSADDVVALPVDELALLVLRDAGPDHLTRARPGAERPSLRPAGRVVRFTSP